MRPTYVLVVTAALLCGCTTAPRQPPPQGVRAVAAAEPARHPATPVRVIDGDTVDLSVSYENALLNLRGTVLRRVRIVGIQAPERNTEAGKAATVELARLLSSGSVEVEVVDGADAFGRLIAKVYVGGVDVGQAMIDGGHATVYVPR